MDHTVYTLTRRKWRCTLGFTITVAKNPFSCKETSLSACLIISLFPLRFPDSSAMIIELQVPTGKDTPQPSVVMSVVHMTPHFSSPRFPIIRCAFRLPSNMKQPKKAARDKDYVVLATCDVKGFSPAHPSAPNLHTLPPEILQQICAYLLPSCLIYPISSTQPDILGMGLIATCQRLRCEMLAAVRYISSVELRARNQDWVREDFVAWCQGYCDERRVRLRDLSIATALPESRRCDPWEYPKNLMLAFRICPWTQRVRFWTSPDSGWGWWGRGGDLKGEKGGGSRTTRQLNRAHKNRMVVIERCVKWVFRLAEEGRRGEVFSVEKIEEIVRLTREDY